MLIWYDSQDRPRSRQIFAGVDYALDMIITLGCPEFVITLDKQVVLRMWIYRDRIVYRAFEDWGEVAQQFMILINRKLNDVRY